VQQQQYQCRHGALSLEVLRQVCARIGGVRACVSRACSAARASMRSVSPLARALPAPRTHARRSTLA
jgi:hypothetical protein